MNNYKNLDTSKLNYVIYCRKSSEGEDKQVQSLETQLRELKEHAEKNNLNIVEIITESKSAHTQGREGFNRMMELIRTGKANAILVIRANRISRNSIDAGYVISLMDEKKLLYIRTPNSTCYTSSSTDKMMIALELIFSKKDSDDKGDMVKEGQKTKALKGYPHGVAALGFLNDKTEEKGNRKWLVDEERYWKIEKLLKMFLEGTWSAGKLYQYAVEDLKLTTVKRNKQGGNLIVLSRIYKILTDPIYAGFFFQDGVRYELNTGLPRMITEGEHEKIKRILSRNNISKFQIHEPIYSEYLKTDTGDFMGQDIKLQLICDCKKKFAYKNKELCPECNKKIYELENPKYITKVYYYSSKAKKSRRYDKTVQQKYLEEEIITNTLIENFSELSNIPKDILDWTKRFINEIKYTEIKFELNKSLDVQKRKEEYENKKSKMRDKLYNDFITKEEYEMDLKRLDNEYADTKVTTATSKVDWVNEIEHKLKLVDDLNILFANSSVKSKKYLLSQLGPNLIWDNEKLIIINKKSVNALIEAIKVTKEEYQKFEPKNELDNKGLKRKNSPFETDFSTMLPVLDEFRTLNWQKIESDLRFSRLFGLFEVKELQN